MASVSSYQSQYWSVSVYIESRPEPSSHSQWQHTTMLSVLTRRSAYSLQSCLLHAIVTLVLLRYEFQLSLYEAVFVDLFMMWNVRIISTARLEVNLKSRYLRWTKIFVWFKCVFSSVCHCKPSVTTADDVQPSVREARSVGQQIQPVDCVLSEWSDWSRCDTCQKKRVSVAILHSWWWAWSCDCR